jgi:hypothetical protein
MKIARPLIVGLSVAVMAGAVGLESFSGAWWVFMIAANTLAAFAGGSGRA